MSSGFLLVDSILKNIYRVVKYYMLARGTIRGRKITDPPDSDLKYLGHIV